MQQSGFAGSEARLPFGQSTAYDSMAIHPYPGIGYEGQEIEALGERWRGLDAGLLVTASCLFAGWRNARVAA
jgi:hypothetical protein